MPNLTSAERQKQYRAREKEYAELLSELGDWPELWLDGESWIDPEEEDPNHPHGGWNSHHPHAGLPPDDPMFSKDAGRDVPAWVIRRLRREAGYDPETGSLRPDFRRMNDEQRVELIADMRLDDFSVRKAAKYLGVSVGLIHQYWARSEALAAELPVRLR